MRTAAKLSYTAALLALLAACGDGTGPGGGGGPAVLAELRFSQPLLQATAGDTVSISVQAYDDSGKAMSVPASLAWNATPASVAAVAGTGANVRVAALSAGTAEIRASAGAVSASMPVTVKDVPALTPSASSLNLAIGETAALTFTADGSAVASSLVSFRVVSEARSLAQVAVLDSAALAQKTLKGKGAGRVRIEASSLRTKPVTLTVDVYAAEPTVALFSHEGLRVGATTDLALYGFGMDRVTSVSIGGVAAAITTRDSTSLRFRVPDGAMAESGTCGGSAKRSVVVSGARQAVPSSLFVMRTGEIDLAVGEYRYLTDAEAACLRLAGKGANAAYMLSGLDVRSIERAKTGPQRLNSDGTFTVTYADVSGGGPSGSLAGRLAGTVAASPAGGMSAQGLLDNFAHTEPYTDGEVFPVSTNGGNGSTKNARVKKIYGGYIVLAEVVDDSAAITNAFRVRLDSALTFMSNEGVAASAAIFGAARPVTSTVSGQILILIDRDGAGGVTFPLNRQAGPVAYIAFGKTIIDQPYVNSTLDMNKLMQIVGHEFAHGFQNSLLAPMGRDIYNSTYTAQEAGADLIGYEILRRFLREPFEGQLPEPKRGDRRNNTQILGPYVNGEDFLHWLAIERVHKGESIEAALGAVTRGMLDGIYGYDERGNKVSGGLTGLMQSLVSPAWDIAQAGLRYSLIAGGLDDRTSNPDLQNSRWYQMEYTWDNGIPTVATGSSAAVTPDDGAGYPFYPGSVSRIRISDSVGGTVQIQPTGFAMKWAIARYQ